MKPCGHDAHHEKARGGHRWMDAKIQSTPRAPAKRVTLEGCTGLFWCCARCRRRGMQNRKNRRLSLPIHVQLTFNVINLDFSFKTRIVSSPNSSGVVRSGFATVFVPDLGFGWGWRHFSTLKSGVAIAFQHSESPGS